LSSEGRAQAEEVCARLATEGVDAIYVSSLRRTAQTAEILVRTLGLEPVVDADLREVFLGEWEGGLLRKKVVDRDPVALRVSAEQRWDVIPGAESAASFAQRVRQAVERIAAAHPDERVAVFSHGGTIGELLAQATGARPLAFTGSDNASISRLVVTSLGWTVRGYNDSAHLAGAKAEDPPTGR
jgi:probable phosphoglycerate mutase